MTQTKPILATGIIYGYCRISRQSQNEDRQIIQLEEICDHVETEKISADCESRPVFDALLKKLKRGDTLIVLDLDRAFRSMVDAILVLHDLTERGIEFRILNSNFDLKDRIGRLMYVIKAHYAEEELAFIRRRTKEGLEAARAKGKRLGRPFALTPTQIKRAHKIMTESGTPLYKVAKRFGVSHSTLAQSFQRLDLAS